MTTHTSWCWKEQIKQESKSQYFFPWMEKWEEQRNIFMFSKQHKKWNSLQKIVKTYLEHCCSKPKTWPDLLTFPIHSYFDRSKWGSCYKFKKFFKKTSRCYTKDISEYSNCLKKQLNITELSMSGHNRDKHYNYLLKESHNNTCIIFKMEADLYQLLFIWHRCRRFGGFSKMPPGCVLQTSLWLFLPAS